MKITTKLIGKRVLFRDLPFIDVEEGMVKEISPSRKYIKIDDSWHSADSVVEILGKEKTKAERLLNAFKNLRLRHNR